MEIDVPIYRQMEIDILRDRQTGSEDRYREIDKQTDRDRCTERHIETNVPRDRQTETDVPRDRQTETDVPRDRQMATDCTSPNFLLLFNKRVQ